MTPFCLRYRKRMRSLKSRQKSKGKMDTVKEEQASSSTLLVHGKIKESDLDLGSSNVHSGSFTLLSFSTEQGALKALDLMSKKQPPLPFSFKPATPSELWPDQLRNCNYISPPHPLPFLWDFENITIPNDYDATKLYTKMQRFLGSQNFEMTLLKGFGIRGAISQKNWSLLKDKFGLQHVDRSDVKDVADFMIQRSLLLHLIDKPQPCPCLVFTGDQDFIEVFKFLHGRGYHIYLGYNSVAPRELRSVVTKAWNYHHVIDYVEPSADTTKKRKNKKRKRNSEVYIVNKKQRGADKLRLKLEQVQQEAERLRLEQEAERLRLEQEAERLRLEQEAERLRLEQEAERLRLEQEAERLRLESEAMRGRKTQQQQKNNGPATERLRLESEAMRGRKTRQQQKNNGPAS